MITLKINGEKKKIPSANELTVNQYIKLIEIGKQDLISYLSACLEKDYKLVFNSKIKNIEYIVKRIGNLEDYKKIKVKNYLSLANGEIYLVSNLGITTIGERFMIEENAKNFKNEELLCFILAICIVENKMDYGKIKEKKDYLMDQPYKNVLPTAFFLLNNFLIGNIKGIKFLWKLKQLIKMKALKSRLVLINFRNILTIMKYKLFARY